MKRRLILASILICAHLPIIAQAVTTSIPAADEVVAKMLIRDTLRESSSRGYTSSREYLLENQRLHKHARMLVNVSCDSKGVEHFEIVSEEGWESANKYVLRELLTAESDASLPTMRSRAMITSDNYSFRMIELGSLEGRRTYVIEVVPKRPDKMLFRGRIWVDAEDYALARVEGELAKSPSFWTRKVHFVQEYHKSGALWFPQLTSSVTDVRVFGTTDVIIRFFEYKPMNEMATAPLGPSLMETIYVKH